MIERAARAAREEIVRQYRDDDRGKCPGGSSFYEEEVAPNLIAHAVLTAIREPDDDQLIGMQMALVDLGGAVLPSNPLRIAYRAAIDAALPTANRT